MSRFAIFSRALIAVVLAVAAFSALPSFDVDAQTPCREYRWQSGGVWSPWFKSIPELCVYFDANGDFGGSPAYSWTVTPGEGGCHYVVHRENGSLVGNYFMSPDWRNVDCPDCAGKAADDLRFNRSGTGSSIPDSGCSGGCRIAASGVGAVIGNQWVQRYKYTGAACSSSDSTSGSDAPPGETCKTGASGLQYCSNPSGGGKCGYINGEYVCLKNIKNDGCKVMSDGSRVCGKDAGTPPVPDNGTPGVPAVADDQIAAKDSETGVTNNYNYYSSGTVSGSSRDPGSSGAPQGSGDNGGSGGGSGVTDGDEEGEEDFGEPAEVDLPGFGSCLDSHGGVSISSAADCSALSIQGAWDDLTNSPLLSAVSGIYQAFGSAGACPSYPITIFGETSDLMEFGCSMLTEHGSVLALFFMVGWSFLGVRIVMDV